MSPDEPPDRRPSEEDDIAAAELALGVLEGAERDAAQARARSEAAFAGDVARWRARFALLAPELDPPAWSEIVSRVPANDDTVPTTALRRWRAAAAGFAAVAAVLAALLATSLPRPAVPARLVATLTGPDAAAVAVGIDPASGSLTVQPAALQSAVAGRAPELWVIPADGRPRSLGLIDPTAPRALAAGSGTRAALVPEATLAISLEPPGGSPTGQPTGPVILSGRIVRL